MTPSAGILRFQLARGLGAQSLIRLLDAFRRDGGTQEQLASAEPRDLLARAGLRPQLASAVEDAQSEAERLAERLASHDIQVLVRGYVAYPTSLTDVLGETAPPVLFVKGNLHILSLPGVGFAGSRKSSPNGLTIAREAARELARRGVNVVSGYANGVDLAAHRAALEAGGATTLVLAEGLLNFRTKGDLADVLDSGRYLVLSEFPPALKWLPRNAMQRNRTICGLCRALVVIESGMEGGTFAAAETAQELRLPLFVAAFANPPPSAEGNAYFLQRGANPLRVDGNGPPDLAPLIRSIGLEGDDCEQPSAQATEVRNGTTNAPLDGASSRASELTTAAPHSQVDKSTDSIRQYPRRLIEVDLPIARISAHARREKSIRHGHISTLHIWWARRPLAACRAVICAALWPDPADPLCPQSFRDAAAKHLLAFSKRVYPVGVTGESHTLQDTASPESLARWELFAKNSPPLDPTDAAHQNVLRFALLDFIADFANWDNSTVPAYLDTSRALTQAAHEALGGEPGTRPLVVDPFAGGGSIPLEALRVGADAFASDLNPVAVLLNKVVLEYIPKYGQKLADEVRKWGLWIKEQAEKELAEFYPKDPDGATPIAYLWARTVISEAPGQADLAVEIPLFRSMWLTKKKGRSRALRWRRGKNGDVLTQVVEKTFADGITRGVRQPLLELFEPRSEREVEVGTSSGGAATCPVTGFTLAVDRVRLQLKSRQGGTADSRLFAVVFIRPGGQGRQYRLPTESDCAASKLAAKRLAEVSRATDIGQNSVLPDGKLNHLRGFFNVILYGMDNWGTFFTPREALTLATLAKLVVDSGRSVRDAESEMVTAIQTCLAMVLDRQANTLTSLSRWNSVGEKIEGLYSRQALPMVWDYAEANPFSSSTGCFDGALEWVEGVCRQESCLAYEQHPQGNAEQCSATSHIIPSHAAAAVVTDPPYYAAVPYADLSDFFFSWLKRSLGNRFPSLLSTPLTPKDDECVQLSHRAAMYRNKDAQWFEMKMGDACREAVRYIRPNGIGVIVFANKETQAWEAMLGALIESSWTVTASWPIDTEMASRLRAHRSAVLGSSIHIVCRPRGRMEVGDWRDVLSELPRRMDEWMPRLASEGVVGADAIFACLGPALEIFSRYSRVEKANGDPVLLKEYLEHVWAAVSKEALSTIFRDADASGLEADARLTTIWLWTVGGGSQSANGKPAEDGETEADGTEDEDEGKSKRAAAVGFTLEFDAARMIAQGLGIHLEGSEAIVEVKGDKARLLAVTERTKQLFGKDTEAGPAGGKKAKKKIKQPSLFDELEDAEEADGGWQELKGPPPGTTILDRLHQAMILFGAQRGELLKRFLVEDGVGTDARFWKLAQSLAALYPPGTDERRWVEGVLARKKALGL